MAETVLLFSFLRGSQHHTGFEATLESGFTSLYVSVSFPEWIRPTDALAVLTAVPSPFHQSPYFLDRARSYFTITYQLVSKRSNEAASWQVTEC